MTHALSRTTTISCGYTYLYICVYIYRWNWNLKKTDHSKTSSAHNTSSFSFLFFCGFWECIQWPFLLYYCMRCICVRFIGNRPEASNTIAYAAILQSPSPVNPRGPCLENLHRLQNLYRLDLFWDLSGLSRVEKGPWRTPRAKRPLVGSPKGVPISEPTPYVTRLVLSQCNGPAMPDSMEGSQ